jgi:hypothetical protein
MRHDKSHKSNPFPCEDAEEEHHDDDDEAWEVALEHSKEAMLLQKERLVAWDTEDDERLVHDEEPCD